VGTYHGPCSALPRRPGPSEEQIEEMLRELNAAVPGWDLRSSTVLQVYSGLLPGGSRGGDETLATSATLHDHGRGGGPQGLFTVLGVKFTTAPVIANRVLQMAGFGGRPVTEVPRPPAREIPDPSSFRRTLATTPGKAVEWVRRLVAEESVLSIEDLLHRRTDWAMDPRAERELEPLIRPLIPELGAAPETLTQARAG